MRKTASRIADEVLYKIATGHGLNQLAGAALTGGASMIPTQARSMVDAGKKMFQPQSFPQGSVGPGAPTGQAPMRFAPADRGASRIQDAITSGNTMQAMMTNTGPLRQRTSQPANDAAAYAPLGTR